MLAISCSKDDSEDIVIPSPITDTKLYSYGITAQAGAATTLEKTMSLDDFTALDTYQKYVYKGSINISSYIEFVKSSTEVTEITDVILQVKNNSKIVYNLGTITGNEEFTSLGVLNFLQLIADELVEEEEEIILQLSFTTTNTIASEVKLNINMDIEFDLK
jgi:hypothetical protein